jgi:hypothetical protein
MSWREFGYLVAGLTALNVIGLIGGRTAEWLTVGVVALGALVASRMVARRRARQIEALKGDTEEERQHNLSDLSAEERSLARLRLGAVSAAHARVNPATGERFAYTRTPRSLRIVIYILTLIMAALPTVLLFLGMVRPDQRIWAALLALGFTASVLILPRAWDAEDAQIFVTASGIQELRPNGDRLGILWSEIAQVRNRRWATNIVIVAADRNRRIRVSYSLREFPRFMELLVAHLSTLHERLK